jgi:AcrR family transcriptional regulator
MHALAPVPTACPYDEVRIERVAEIAGVSRGLLYHYFPAKRDFFAAVVDRESARMLRMTAAVPGLPVREQLTANLDTYPAYVEEHAHGFRAFHRAEASGDRAVRGTRCATCAPAPCWASSPPERVP